MADDATQPRAAEPVKPSIHLVEDVNPFKLEARQIPVLIADRKRKFVARLKAEFTGMVYDGDFTTTPNTTSVLVALCHKCCSRGVVALPLAALVRMTRLSRHAVVDALVVLESDGQLRRRGKNGKGMTTTYEIVFING